MYVVCFNWYIKNLLPVCMCALLFSVGSLPHKGGPPTPHNIQLNVFSLFSNLSKGETNKPLYKAFPSQEFVHKSRNGYLPQSVTTAEQWRTDRYSVGKRCRLGGILRFACSFRFVKKLTGVVPRVFFGHLSGHRQGASRRGWSGGW
jgi:hypothetical protein